MNTHEVLTNAFAMPLTNPAYPRGPYKFYHREHVIIAYRASDVVNYEFIRMPDSTGWFCMRWRAHWVFPWSTRRPWSSMTGAPSSLWNGPLCSRGNTSRTD